MAIDIKECGSEILFDLGEEGAVILYCEWRTMNSENDDIPYRHEWHQVGRRLPDGTLFTARWKAPHE